MKVSVLGATGYAGAELLRILYNHPQAEVVHITSESHTGEKIAALYPHLLAVTDEIVRLGAENALSWEYDSTMWPGTATALNAGYPSGFSDFAGDENLTSYEAVIQNLIGCYLARLDGMNTLITSATAEGGFAVSETTF